MTAQDLTRPWCRSTFTIALVGSLLMWAALPPLALGWLAWIAPVPWLLLIRANDLPGRRPYRALYFAGLIFWLLAIHWLRLPHPLTYFGWFALSAYLAIYVPLFVGLSRVAMFRFALPLWLAAPIVFTGLELARAHMLTGFLMGSLAHTQVDFTTLIQISDLVGEYGVDFVIILVASCITEILWIADCGTRIGDPPKSVAIPNLNSKWRKMLVSMFPAAGALAITLIYGSVRLPQVRERSQPGALRIALIQGNSLANWKFDPDREGQIMKEYIDLSERAVAAAKKDGHPVDLIVWPETMFRSPLRDFDAGFKLPQQITLTTGEITVGDYQQLVHLATHLGVAILVGIDRIHFVADEQSATDRPTFRAFNSSVLVDRAGTIVGTYDKMHRVMFGEYIPFADWIPFLYKLTPLTGGIIAGADPVALRPSTTLCVAPNICYETAIPHVIRHQVATLTSRGQRPDVLVNLTNDAWYWGSSELDMHLACDVFRAVETRLPLVIAANGGLTASIDCSGRVQAQLKRQEPNYLLADVGRGLPFSWYTRLGDWFAGLCLAACIFFAIVEVRARRALRTRQVAPPTDL